MTIVRIHIDHVVLATLETTVSAIPLLTLTSPWRRDAHTVLVPAGVAEPAAVETVIDYLRTGTWPVVSAAQHPGVASVARVLGIVPPLGPQPSDPTAAEVAVAAPHDVAALGAAGFRVVGGMPDGEVLCQRVGSRLWTLQGLQASTGRMKWIDVALAAA